MSYSDAVKTNAPDPEPASPPPKPVTQAAMSPAEVSEATPQDSPERTTSQKPPGKETCFRWNRDGTCPDPACTYYEVFFPIIVNRAHANGIKIETCERWLEGSCPWADDTCGYAHEVVDDEQARRRKRVEKAILPQGWHAEMILKCESCPHEIVQGAGTNSSVAVLAMVEHCKGCNQMGKGGKSSDTVTMQPIGDGQSAKAFPIRPTDYMSKENWRKPDSAGPVG